jgi:CRISPR-associated protein Cas1
MEDFKMMSTRDFEHKQIAFVFTDEEEKISFKNDNLIVTDRDGKIKHQSTCYRLFALFICGNYSLTTGVVDKSKKFGFTIVFMTPNLRVTSIMPAKAEGNVLLRQKQYFYNQTDIGAYIISNKLHNQNFLLKRKRSKTEHEKMIIEKLDEYEKIVLAPGLSLQEIMGIEGIGAKIYFNSLFSAYDWKSRQPRVKNDITNTLMDIGYTILFNIINALLEMYGFDVYVGVLHTQFFHRKSLVCDLEEPFRPIVDSAILKALNLGQVKEKDFWKKQNQYILPWKNSKKYVGIILEAILEYRNEIFIYLQNYYRAFMREKPIQEFPVFYMEES